MIDPRANIVKRSLLASLSPSVRCHHHDNNIRVRANLLLSLSQPEPARNISPVLDLNSNNYIHISQFNHTYSTALSLATNLLNPTVRLQSSQSRTPFHHTYIPQFPSKSFSYSSIPINSQPYGKDKHETSSFSVRLQVPFCRLISRQSFCSKALRSTFLLLRSVSIPWSLLFCFIDRPFVMGAAENVIDNKIDRLSAEVKEILKSLASKWGDELDLDALKVIPLKGAMTNEVFQLKWPTATEKVSRKVLLRLYGEGVEVFFDRSDEIRTFEFMSKHGQGPRLLGRFPAGRVEEFINARTLSASDMRDPEISALIAAKMKEFHDLDMPGSKEATLWDRLRNWLKVAKSLSPPEEAKAFRFDDLEGEIDTLEKALYGSHQHIGFCHNDLQYGNIMIDEETKSITIIDYEYASYNPVAYDIANHFCEMAADYHTETPHLLDYSKYPDLEERQRFLRAYLSSTGHEHTDEEVKQLLQDVEKYTLASHLIWGLWGIISEHVNEIDFDYIEYARQRVDQYWLTKPELLGSSGADSYALADGNDTI